MITVGMNYHVLEGKQQDFEDKFAAVIDALNAAEGHTSSTLWKDVGDGASYLITSEWSDEAAFAAFVQSAGVIHGLGVTGNDDFLFRLQIIDVHLRVQGVHIPDHYAIAIGDVYNGLVWLHNVVGLRGGGFIPEEGFLQIFLNVESFLESQAFLELTDPVTPVSTDLTVWSKRWITTSHTPYQPQRAEDACKQAFMARHDFAHVFAARSCTTAPCRDL